MKQRARAYSLHFFRHRPPRQSLAQEFLAAGLQEETPVESASLPEPYTLHALSGRLTIARKLQNILEKVGRSKECLALQATSAAPGGADLAQAPQLFSAPCKQYLALPRRELRPLQAE